MAALPEVAVALTLPAELLLATAVVMVVVDLGFHAQLAVAAAGVLEGILAAAETALTLAPQQHRLAAVVVVVAEDLTQSLAVVAAGEPAFMVWEPMALLGPMDRQTQMHVETAEAVAAGLAEVAVQPSFPALLGATVEYMVAAAGVVMLLALPQAQAVTARFVLSDPAVRGNSRLLA